MNPVTRLLVYHERAVNLIPAEDRRRRLSRVRAWSNGMFMCALFDLNGWAIDRFGGEPPEVWDPTRFGWVRSLEERWREVREELAAYLEEHDGIPHVAEVSGLTPGSAEARHAAPVDRGEWRTLILAANGGWIDDVVRWFPNTRDALAACPHMTTIGFSALAPGSHIAEHVGTNRGALRVQLPLIVPGDPGACRIRVGAEMLHWVEGESVVFDLAAPHEAWNDSDGTRVLLMIETIMPLAGPAGWLNRFVQRQYRRFPPFRRMPDRVRDLQSRDALNPG